MANINGLGVAYLVFFALLLLIAGLAIRAVVIRRKNLTLADVTSLFMPVSIWFLVSFSTHRKEFFNYLIEPLFVFVLAVTLIRVRIKWATASPLIVGGIVAVILSVLALLMALQIPGWLE